MAYVIQNQVLIQGQDGRHGPFICYDDHPIMDIGNWAYVEHMAAELGPIPYARQPSWTLFQLLRSSWDLVKANSLLGKYQFSIFINQSTSVLGKFFLCDKLLNGYLLVFDNALFRYSCPVL